MVQTQFPYSFATLAACWHRPRRHILLPPAFELRGQHFLPVGRVPFVPIHPLLQRILGAPSSVRCPALIHSAALSRVLGPLQLSVSPSWNPPPRSRACQWLLHTIAARSFSYRPAPDA